MLILTLFITVIYILIIGSFIVGFDKIKQFNTLDKKPVNSFSIVIPFRNEAENLPELLDSLSKLNYPNHLFEVIFIDDKSTDNGKNTITDFLKENPNFSIQIINNFRKSNSPKKDAIETAIKKSVFGWIITTDADCVVATNWLLSFDNFIQKKHPKMICAPVTYQVKNNLLEQFQILDFISLIGTTIGAFGINKPFLCNGANLCYSKKVFIEVNGFEGNNSISSGDDIFLLEKILDSYPNDVHIIKSKNSIVTTKPESTFNKLFQQRIRWASKTSATNNSFGKFVGVSVLFMNLLIIGLVISTIFNSALSNILLWVFIAKFIIDFTLIRKTLYFTNQLKNLLFYPIISIFYPFFVILVTFSSITKKSILWKNRQIYD